MIYVENKSFIPTERQDSSSYWTSRFILGSLTQPLIAKEFFMANRCADIAPGDIHSIEVEADAETEFLRIDVGLESEDCDLAFLKASGVVLLALRDAGIELEDVELEDGRLASGEALLSDRAFDPTIDLSSLHYSLDEPLERSFYDLVDTMVEYGSTV